MRRPPLTICMLTIIELPENCTLLAVATPIAPPPGPVLIALDSVPRRVVNVGWNGRTPGPRC